MKVRALIMIEAEVADQAVGEAWAALFDLIANGYAEDDQVKFCRPNHQQICDFVVAQTNYIIEEEPEPLKPPEPASPFEGISVDEERKRMLTESASLEVAKVPAPDGPIPDQRTLVYHWLRISHETRMDKALGMGLLTEDQLTSLKRYELDGAILKKARELGVVPELWKYIQTQRKAWGEI